MRRLAEFCLVATVAIAACGGSSGTPAPGGGGGGNATQAPGGGGADTWSTGGSAKVTVGGTVITISPGGCLDGGSLGVDFRFGDSTSATADWIIGIAHHDGHQPDAISGKVGGKPFVLADDRTGTISGNTGTFAGTDSIGGNGAISATFSCS